VFLDRDGTIIEEVGYLKDPSQVKLIPGAAEAIARLNRRGIVVVVVTNQSGVGRGLVTESAVGQVHAELARQLEAAEGGGGVGGGGGGGRWDAIYYCPHLPDDGCDCRKPGPGMFRRAAAEHGLDLGRSFVVGDKASDVRAGTLLGCRTVLVLTGYGVQEAERVRESGLAPDHVAADLDAATDWVLRALNTTSENLSDRTRQRSGHARAPSGQ
jgi:histidinol-phosphate phosphatase family protein